MPIATSGFSAKLFAHVRCSGVRHRHLPSDAVPPAYVPNNRGFQANFRRCSDGSVGIVDIIKIACAAKPHTDSCRADGVEHLGQLLTCSNAHSTSRVPRIKTISSSIFQTSNWLTKCKRGRACCLSSSLGSQVSFGSQIARRLVLGRLCFSSDDTRPQICLAAAS